MMNYKTAMKYLEIMMEKHQDVLLRLKNNGPEYYNNSLKNLLTNNNSCVIINTSNQGGNKNG